MTSPRMPCRSEQGFGLVETLIAVAVIAMMAALAFQGISTNAQATRMIADRRAAAMIAQSALDGAASGDASPADGTAGNFRWRIATEPYAGNVGTAPPLNLITVTVSRAGAAKPVFQLRTLRLAR